MIRMVARKSPVKRQEKVAVRIEKKLVDFAPIGFYKFVDRSIGGKKTTAIQESQVGCQK